MSFKSLSSINSPIRNYHINKANSNILKGLKTYNHSNLNKIVSCSKIRYMAETCIRPNLDYIASKFLKLVLKASSSISAMFKV